MSTAFFQNGCDACAINGNATILDFGSASDRHPSDSFAVFPIASSMKHASLSGHTRVKPTAAIKIVGIYLIIGCLWIFFSDRLLNYLIRHVSDPMTQLQTLKGWLYVVATAVMLYWLINRETNKSQHATTKLKNTLAELQATQAALQQSETRFRTFMDHSPAVAWITDSEGRVEYVSRTYLDLFQLPPNVLGRNMFDLYPHELAQTYLDNIQAVAQSGQMLETIEPGIRADGCPVEFLVYKFPLPQLDGSTHVGGVAIDVTDRKRAEVALQRSEEQLQLALNFAQIGSWDWDLPTKQIIWNKTHFHLLGLDPETVEASYDQWRACVHPDDLTHVEAAIQNALANRTIYIAEYRVIHPDGSLHWVLGKGQAIYANTGHPIRMIGVLLDITDRKETEELLRLREQQFRQAIVNAPYPLILHAEDGEVVQINRAWTELSGYDANDIPTIADWAEKAYGQRMGPMRANIDRLYALNERVHEGEFTPQTKDGQQRIWDFSSAPVGKLPDGRRLVLSMAADITERKQAEIHLRAALAEKEVLLKEIHHRVKNNLQIISGLLQLQAQGLEDAQMVNALRESQSRIESMSLIHKKLYTSSDLGQIDVVDYIQSLATSLLTTYQITPGRVTLTVAVEPVTLNLDQAIPCGLIINELVSNALKYAFPDSRSGEINVKLCRKNAYFELTIQDNGIGLPTSLDWQNAPSLGLSLVHALATEQLEGTLSVECHGGTKFMITFP